MTSFVDIVQALHGGRYSYRDESELQRAIEQRLTDAGIEFEAEIRLTLRDRIDFLVGTIGIEVKVAGTTDALRRQLLRYAMSPRINGLLVVTTMRRHLQVTEGERGRVISAHASAGYLPADFPTLKPVEVLHLGALS